MSGSSQPVYDQANGICRRQGADAFRRQHRPAVPHGADCAETHRHDAPADVSRRYDQQLSMRNAPFPFTPHVANADERILSCKTKQQMKTRSPVRAGGFSPWPRLFPQC
jgi:hypothetical protein